MSKVVQGVMFTHLADADPRYDQLAEKLVEHAGRRLAPMPEENMDALLASGQFYKPSKVRMVEGERSECHINSARYAAKHKGFQVHIGYAVSDDGCWRQHSWCWNPETKVLAETTGSRDAYFGILDTDPLPTEEQVRLPGLPY